MPSRAFYQASDRMFTIMCRPCQSLRHCPRTKGQARRRSTDPNFWVRRSSGGVGEGVGAKMPLKTQGNKTFWRDIPRFCLFTETGSARIAARGARIAQSGFLSRERLAAWGARIARSGFLTRGRLRLPRSGFLQKLTSESEQSEQFLPTPISFV